MMRPLRAALLVVGLIPAIVLIAVVGYGLLAPNTWAISSSVALDAAPEDVIPLAEDVTRWRDWMLVEQRDDPGFETIEQGGRPTTAAGATISWNTSYRTGDLMLTSEWEDALSYSMDWRERRAGRPPAPSSTAVLPGSRTGPTAWVETTGTVEVRLADDGITLTLLERGRAGPRPLGPFLVSSVAETRQDVLDARLTALAEVVQRRAFQRRAAAP